MWGALVSINYQDAMPVCLQASSSAPVTVSSLTAAPSAESSFKNLSSSKNRSVIAGTMLIPMPQYMTICGHTGVSEPARSTHSYLVRANIVSSQTGGFAHQLLIWSCQLQHCTRIKSAVVSEGLKHATIELGRNKARLEGVL